MHRFTFALVIAVALGAAACGKDDGAQQACVEACKESVKRIREACGVEPGPQASPADRDKYNKCWSDAADPQNACIQACYDKK